MIDSVYEISNIIFIVSIKINVPYSYSLFTVSSSDINYSTSKLKPIIFIHYCPQCVENDIENFKIVKNISDIMLVNDDYTKATIAQMNYLDSFDTFMMQLFYTHAVQKHTIQVHSSLVEYNDYGVMFLGPSGIGKTTQAELWNKYLNALIINGDCVFVEDKGKKFIGWGTPWHGSSPYCENTSVPIKAWVVLKQGKENSLRRLEGFEMVSEVSKNIIYPMWLEKGTELALETLDHILRGVPVYELVNRADEESVIMVKQEVFENEKD